MFNRLFNRSKSIDLSLFLQEVYHNNKDPYTILAIKADRLQKATLDQILNNFGDVADGVSMVQMDFSRIYFNFFSELIIKTYDNGLVRWMFYDIIDNPNTVFDVFNNLRKELGEGIVHDRKFSTFDHVDKVKALSMGRYSSSSDEIIHLWQNSKVTVSLNYQLESLRRLVLSLNFYPDKKKNTAIRDKGTLLGMMKNDLRLLLIEPEISARQTQENGLIKFIDYSYQLDPPELNNFDMVDIRLFSLAKSIDEELHTNVTYWSTKAIEIEEVIVLVDQLARLYGTDNHGDEEMKPHEIDMVENGEFWTGRSWDFSNNHQLVDCNDENPTYLYNLRLDFNPEDQGLTISIIAYNKMLAYHLQHFR